MALSERADSGSGYSSASLIKYSEPVPSLQARDYDQYSAIGYSLGAMFLGLL